MLVIAAGGTARPFYKRGIVVKVTLGNVDSTSIGFTQLATLAEQTRGYFFQPVEIDLSSTTWIAADMCAALGAVLRLIESRGCRVVVTGPVDGLRKVLCRNRFLGGFGYADVPDGYNTAITYRHFDSTDQPGFQQYVAKELMSRSDLPKMSAELNKKMTESVFEIFDNAVIHSRTRQGIFGCGQVFPKRHRLVFTIADLGVGIQANVRELGLDLPGPAAIVWALEGRNTTKRGPIPGGLGLKLLRDFIEKNGGRMLICSNDGLWQMVAGRQSQQFLHLPFPGTVVTVEINTADTQSYMLSTEVPASGVF